MKTRRPLFVFAVALLAACSVGCMGTFREEAIFAASTPKAAGEPSPEKVKRCDTIDNHQLVWGGATVVLGAVAGASGITYLPVSDPRLKDGLVVTAGVAGLAAVGTGLVWDSKQKQWVREGCATAYPAAVTP